MLYYLHLYTEYGWDVLNVFQYITFRSIGAAGTAFLIVLLLGPATIRLLQRLNLGQNVRQDEVLSMQLHKQGTPTMGGVLIIAGVVFATFLWAIPTNPYVWMVVLTLVVLGTLGFWDDYLKIRGRSADGLSARGKILVQALWAAVIFTWLYTMPRTHDQVLQLMVPFLKEPVIETMWVPAAALFLVAVMVGASNAVNLTDGMDGLAIGCSNAAALAYMVMAYAAGNVIFADYLYIPYLPDVGELAIFCAALLGAGLGFLWYNCHPARVFMGDTGSLAIGGAIATVAILIKQELVLILVGGVFVMEAVSVLMQVAYFKRTGGKRIFRCTPIHHHFELVAKENAKKEGRNPDAVETMVVVRMWILAILFAILGIASLKIR